MMYDMLNKARRDGLVALETDIEEPDKSPVLSQYPAFLKDHHVRDFVCNTMRMAVTGGIEPFDVPVRLSKSGDTPIKGCVSRTSQRTPLTAGSL